MKQLITLLLQRRNFRLGRVRRRRIVRSTVRISVD